MTCTIISSGDEFRTSCRNESEKPVIAVKAKVWEAIWSLYCGGYDRFYVNCDYGIPLWAAEWILSLKIGNKIELHIMIPYEEQTTEWLEEMRDRYFAVHAKADSVTMVSTQYDASCYQDTNERMIDESDVLLICGKRGSIPSAEEYAAKSGTAVVYMEVI